MYLTQCMGIANLIIYCYHLDHFALSKMNSYNYVHLHLHHNNWYCVHLTTHQPNVLGSIYHCKSFSHIYHRLSNLKYTYLRNSQDMLSIIMVSTSRTYYARYVMDPSTWQVCSLARLYVWTYHMGMLLNTNAYTMG